MRVSQEPFPVSTEATARDYNFAPSPQPEGQAVGTPVADAEPGAQQTLFANPNSSRVVAFDTLTSPAERESIRARAAEMARPAPVKQVKVELRRARASKKTSTDQQRLDFFGNEEVVSLPQSHIICDAPVAPIRLRLEAAATDGAMMLGGILMSLAGYLYVGGRLSFDKHSLPFLLLAILTIPLFYKLMWTFVGRDSVGLSMAALRLVDFDGNPPSRSRRYQRLLGSFISILAAGTGLVWALVDEDALTWHDHISGTFPTLS